jgi:hypothetical protein
MNKDMKYNIIFLFLALFLYSSCTDSDETSNQVKNAEDTTININTAILNSYSDKLKSLIKTPEGDFRGVSIGMSVDQVKKIEDTSDIQEETPAFIEYMLNYAELESAEVRYMLKKSIVSDIEINIYPRNLGSQDTLFRDLKNYLQEKYKTSKEDSLKSISLNQLKWETSNRIISLSRQGNEKIHDIRLVFNRKPEVSAGINP